MSIMTVQLDSANDKDIDADSSHRTRDRAKASGRELRRETKTLQARVAELERQRCEDRIEFINLRIEFKRTQLEMAELAERYNSIAICLRAFNDRIFEDTRPGGLTKPEISSLKRYGVSYITALVTFNIENFKETHRRPRSKTSATFIDAFDKALLLLSPQELALCRELEARLTEEVSFSWRAQQDPKLDASTVLNTVRALIDPSHLSTLEDLINSNPQRMRKDDDRDDTDRSLFSVAGSSNELFILKNEITKLEEELKKLRARLAARGGDADHGAGPSLYVE